MPGLDFLVMLQSLRTPLGDVVFHVASALGSEVAYLAVLSIVYLCYSHRFGFHLMVAFLLSDYSNSQLKWIFDTQRPFELFPDKITGLYTSGAGGGAYPSGHAQHATVVWGLLALRTGRRSLRYLALAAIAVIAFSRLYLGVHWPVDVVGGVLAGAALMLAYLALTVEWAEGRLVMRSADWAVLAIGGIGMMLVFGWHDGTCVRATGALLGSTVGFALLQRRGYDARGPMGTQLLKVGIALAVLLTVKLLLGELMGSSPAAYVLRYATTAFIGAYALPVAFTEYGLAPPTGRMARLGQAALNRRRAGA